MIDKTLSLKKIRTDLEEAECRIMGGESELHIIYTKLKKIQPWAEENPDTNQSHNEKFGLTNDELVLIHRFMFAGAFENARLRIVEGPEASARKSVELLETVQSADYPSHEFFNNYFKYEQCFAKKMHLLDHPEEPTATKSWCWIGGVTSALLLIILAAVIFLNN